MTSTLPPVPEPWIVGPVSRTDFVRYQGASGDFNPIHHDELFAKAAGYPTVFTPGMWPAGLLATYATDWLGPENLRSFRVRFRAQIWPGDVLTCTAEVLAERVDDDGDPRVDVVLRCRRQDDQEAITAWATFVVAADG